MADGETLAFEPANTHIRHRRDAKSCNTVRQRAPSEMPLRHKAPTVGTREPGDLQDAQYTTIPAFNARANLDV